MFSKLIGLALCAVGIVKAQLTAQTPLNSNAHTAVSASNEQNATIFSLVYGFPLTEYVVFANSLANQSGGQWTTNSLFHQTALTNASCRDVVRPNVDTLYSESLIDLSENDVVATMPPLEAGRFYVWPFYDVYGNNFCNLGTASNDGPGKYLITYDPSHPDCVAPSSDNNYVGIIHMPTPYGAGVLRIQVDNSTDVDYVVAPGPHSRLLNDCLDIANTSLISCSSPRGFSLQPAEVAEMQLGLRHSGTGRHLGGDYSPPAASIWPLRYPLPSLLSPVWESGLGARGHGWASFPADLCGDFQSNYAMRAYIALDGYMQLQATEALYPFYVAGGELFSNQSYTVEFSGKPQVNGFWSLTVYDEDGYLVENNLNVYSLNNRDNITYTNGSRVRDSPPDSSAPFYMLLQSTDYWHRPIGSPSERQFPPIRENI
ncbi:hypothetical protein B0H13DRAFT_2361135 [Mycena leptocephala]|nr:hypothetical protein B0H13DRAFT_2361135 [Mycena leptocephala]